MKTIVYIFAFLLALPACSQDSKVYFKDALSLRISEYNKKLEEAIYYNDRERSEFLFDSLFNNHLKNTYIQNLSLNRLKGKTLYTDDIELPYVLITKSSWFPHDMEEVEIINSVALRFENQIKIIVLYWGDKKTTHKLSKSYDDAVEVTYVDEIQNNHNEMIKTFKHSFGAPACFFVSQTKQLVSLDRVFSLVSENSNINSLESTNKQLALLLFKEDTIHEGVITTTDNEAEDESRY